MVFGRDPKEADIGFVGLGMMGDPMAQNLLRAGFKVRVYDIRPEAAKNTAAMGATLTKSASGRGDSGRFAQNDGEEQGEPPRTEPRQPIPIAPAGRFRNARRRLGEFAHSGGSRERAPWSRKLYPGRIWGPHDGDPSLWRHCSVYTLPIHELKKGVKLGDTFG
jgi:hypothetical protein